MTREDLTTDGGDGWADGFFVEHVVKGRHSAIEIGDFSVSGNGKTEHRNRLRGMTPTIARELAAVLVRIANASESPKESDAAK